MLRTLPGCSLWEREQVGALAAGGVLAAGGISEIVLVWDSCLVRCWTLVGAAPRRPRSVLPSSPRRWRTSRVYRRGGGRVRRLSAANFGLRRTSGLSSHLCGPSEVCPGSGGGRHGPRRCTGWRGIMAIPAGVSAGSSGRPLPAWVGAGRAGEGGRPGWDGAGCGALDGDGHERCGVDLAGAAWGGGAGAELF